MCLDTVIPDLVQSLGPLIIERGTSRRQNVAARPGLETPGRINRPSIIYYHIPVKSQSSEKRAVIQPVRGGSAETGPGVTDLPGDENGNLIGAKHGTRHS